MQDSTIEVEKANVPRLMMQEQGRVGLPISNGQILEDARTELRWPNVVHTYRRMEQDATISAAKQIYEMLIARAKFYVDAPYRPTAEEKRHAEFITQCMHDMDHSWLEFIKEVSSVWTYGFAIHEKVYRKRTKDKGSKYNDNLVGWKKLAPRAQDTISKWLYSEDGRDIIGLEQTLTNSVNGSRYARLLATTGGTVEIPRSKYLHFRVDPKRDNPLGTSPLKAVYFAWRYRMQIEEQEAIGISRDMNGLPVIMIPPRYMSPDALPEEKAVYEYYKNIIRNIHMNEQSGLVLPQAFDPDTKQPLFSFKLMSTEGGKQYDSDATIRRYDNKILTALLADVLVMGQDSVGSYALAGVKTDILTMAVEARLQEICDVLNHDLIPQTFALNGWSAERLPQIKFEELATQDLEEFSKAIQRIAATGMIEVDREILNKIREVLGVDPRPDDEEVDWESLSTSKSRAGDGMQEGLGSGTGNAVSSRDDSAQNMDNSA